MQVHAIRVLNAAFETLAAGERERATGFADMIARVERQRAAINAEFDAALADLTRRRDAAEQEALAAELIAACSDPPAQEQSTQEQSTQEQSTQEPSAQVTSAADAAAPAGSGWLRGMLSRIDAEDAGAPQNSVAHDAAMGERGQPRAA